MDRFNDPISFPWRWKRDGPPEPFYAEALPCESCGAPIEERFPAEWNPDLLIGECCRVEPVEAPYEPRCLGEYAALMSSDNVGEMVDAVQKHRMSCAVCQGVRRGMGREDRSGEERRSA